MKIINKKTNQIIFSAKVEEPLANAIRRYVNHIPMIAIDEVEIAKNDSPLYDETIAHRIGLIPLKMDKSFDPKKEVKLKLNVSKEGTVCSGEFSGSIKPIYNNIPLTILKKGQELELVGIVRVGKGRQHSKFSPGIMFYRNIVDVTVSKDCPSEVANSCPKKILKMGNNGVVVENPDLCDLCGICIEKGKKLGKKDCVKLIPTKELLIVVESFGQIEEKEIFKKAIEELKRDLAELDKKISK